MGLLDMIFNRRRDIGMSFDIEDLALYYAKSDEVHLKRLAIEMCISFLARTISQSEFRVAHDDEFVRDELWYKLNVRPSKNVTASTFWQTFIKKLVYDNEVLVIQSDDGDLLIADDYCHKEYAVYDDVFSNVVVKDFEFKRTFVQSDVIHLRFGNERLGVLIDKLFEDYGDLFRRIIEAQKRKGQIRGTIDMDMVAAKSEKHQAQLQAFIDNMYKAIGKKDVALIPQQQGFEYKELSGNGVSGASVDEVNKVTNGYLEQLALALGIPMSLLRGDMSDVDAVTKNYMHFTVSPLLQKIVDEMNVKFFTKREFLDKNHHVVVRKPSYRNMFDLATAIDKLISSGAFNGNEIRTEMGYEPTDEEIHMNYFITKNYQDGKDALDGDDEESDDDPDDDSDN